MQRAITAGLEADYDEVALVHDVSHIRVRRDFHLVGPLIDVEAPFRLVEYTFDRLGQALDDADDDPCMRRTQKSPEDDARLTGGRHWRHLLDP
jgi:hypothetical protein